MRHLIDIESLGADSARALIERAAALREQPAARPLADRWVANLFYEPSTRTRVSFEIAAGRLGARVVNISAAASSAVKGEALIDELAVLTATGVDAVVLRHPRSGAFHELLASGAELPPLVNAGDGDGAHPSQALIDALTLRDHFGSLAGLSVIIAGDLRHSRVARSNVALLTALGIGELRLAAPPEWRLSTWPAGAPVREFEDLDAALEGVDAVMMLRIQRERLEAEAPNAEAYHRRWGLTSRRLERAADGAVVLHPGPMNRGVEIDAEVADGPRSVIRRQLANGVWMRMAILEWLLAAF